MAAETAAQRYARDWASQSTERKDRGLDAQPNERTDRLYVHNGSTSVNKNN
jgi:hypothetical protein